MRCRWGTTECDAHYTSWRPGSLRVPIDQLVKDVTKKLLDNNCKQLVITGGEPTVQGEGYRALAHLVKKHLYNGTHITVETNGTIFAGGQVNLICLSPKLRSSVPVGSKYEKMHEKNRWDPEEIKKWMKHYDYYFKLVINTPADLEEVKEMLAEVEQPLNDPRHVLFMPQGITQQELWERGKWLAELCKQVGARFTPRIQVDLWGNTPGT